MTRTFATCPFCGYSIEGGFTGIWFRYDIAEIQLTAATFVEHRHVGVNLPSPVMLAIGGEGGRVSLPKP